MSLSIRFFVDVGSNQPVELEEDFDVILPARKNVSHRSIKEMGRVGCRKYSATGFRVYEDSVILFEQAA